MQVAHAGVRYGGALIGAARAGDHNVLLEVRLHLPDVAGVRLLNVHDVEGGPILVLFVELVERGNLPAKGWSSVAAEDQDHWFAAVERRQANARAFVKPLQAEIRRRTPGANVAAASHTP